MDADLATHASAAELAALRQAAGRGEAAAQVELAGRLLVGRDAPIATEEGMTLLRAAVAQDDAAALNLMATLTSTGAWTRQSWPQAMDYLERAAVRGDADARAQLLLIAGDRPLAGAVERGAATGGDVWGRLKASADLERFVQPPAPDQVCEAPRIWVAKGFATPGECQWLMGAPATG